MINEINCISALSGEAWCKGMFTQNVWVGGNRSAEDLETEGERTRHPNSWPAEGKEAAQATEQRKCRDKQTLGDVCIWRAWASALNCGPHSDVEQVEIQDPSWQPLLVDIGKSYYVISQDILLEFRSETILQWVETANIVWGTQDREYGLTLKESSLTQTHPDLLYWKKN